MLLIVCCLWLSYRTQVFSNTQANNSNTTVLALPQTHAMLIVPAQQSPGAPSICHCFLVTCQSQQPPHLPVPVPPDTEYKGAEFSSQDAPPPYNAAMNYTIKTVFCLCDSPIKSSN